jgi:hypothetical protein
VVGRAPVALRLEEAGGKHLREDVVIVALDANLLRGEMNGNAGVAARRRLRKECDIGLHIVALDLAKPLEELWRPGQAGDGVVGLVAAETHDRLAELVAHSLLVLLVREAQVLLRRRGIEIILQRLRVSLTRCGLVSERVGEVRNS